MGNLEKLRVSRHLSQLKLTELFHISRQSAWKYENDLARPDPELIIAFANFFSTSTDYLVGNTDNPRKHETLSETELSEDGPAYLCLYCASASEIRGLSEQMMQLYFDMRSGSEKE